MSPAVNRNGTRTILTLLMVMLCLSSVPLGVTAQTNNTTTTENGTSVAADSPQGIDSIWDNYLFFVTLLIVVIAGVGLASGSMAVAAHAGYLAFAFIALETGTPILENILYVTLVLVFIGFAFKFWRLEGMGNGE